MAKNVTVTPPTGADIAHAIGVVRERNVMLDSDLAALYGVDTKVLIQAVKRNLARFPEDFMFLLSKHELANLRSQIVTSSWGGRRSAPYVFTEQGVAMLSSVLRSERAVAVNIEIMRTFVQLRGVVSGNAELARKMEHLGNCLGVHESTLVMHTEAIAAINAVLDTIRGVLGPKKTPTKTKLDS